LNGMSIRWWKKIEDIFTHFDGIHECDRHPDGRDDIGPAYA